MSDAPAPDSIRRNTWFALAEKLSGAFFTAIVTLYLVRALGPDGYGTYALALGIGALILLPSNLGIAQAASRFVAEQRDDNRSVTAIVADSLWLKLVLGGVMSILLFALADPIADAYGTEELAWPLRVTAVVVFGQSMMLLCDSLFEAIGKVSIYLRVVLAESAVEAVLTISLVVLGGGAVGAIAGRAAAFLFAAVVGLVLLFRTIGFGAHGGRRRGGGHRRRILRYGSALLVIDGVFTLFSRIDVLLIGALISVPAVAFYEAPARLMAFFGYAGSAAATGVAPRMARGPEGPNSAAFERALRYLLVIQGALAAPLLVWPEPITDIALGSGYEESVDVLRALAPFAVLVGVSPLLARAVNYLGEAGRRVPIVVGALLVNVALDVILLPKIGVVAAAIATDVAYTLYVIGHLWLCYRLVGLELRPLLVTLTRTLLAAGAMALVLLAFGTSDVPIPLVLLGGALGLVAYGAMLLLTREVDLATLMQARRRLWAALPRPAR